MGNAITRNSACFAFVLCLCVSQVASAQGAAPASTPAPAATPAQADTPLTPPQVKPPAPGVFSVKPAGVNRFRLTVTGHIFSGREAIEKYLAYRAAQQALDQKAGWFLFVERRSKGDTAPKPRRDPAGMRYSFRMAYFRPVWRYKTAGAPGWKSWSPFSGAAFWADGVDPKSVTDYSVTVDIALQKGPYEDDNPLAFDAGALSDFLVSQVDPPQ
jgi:hypothetical protein